MVVADRPEGGPLRPTRNGCLRPQPVPTAQTAATAIQRPPVVVGQAESLWTAVEGSGLALDRPISLGTVSNTRPADSNRRWTAQFNWTVI
ncbi:hypothetical protein PGTUg99_010814 [Puccinia graminis f. sp. tritici]|uniref:Uncharacterized protein n=1 Tax=Puccinia graminis f. sp. tritici TaxID=56615 RepID=A0A5B0NIP9_PUCGR|nr:hypothetical protein PGTUg99_010814 [Puccinia graminis f. sp. tritici]